jgi:hypothetical protein
MFCVSLFFRANVAENHANLKHHLVHMQRITKVQTVNQRRLSPLFPRSTNSYQLHINKINTSQHLSREIISHAATLANVFYSKNLTALINSIDKSSISKSPIAGAEESLTKVNCGLRAHEFASYHVGGFR